jgi:hypothetical protein
VIALWQDGFPRYRLYDDYSKLNSLVKVIRAQTDLRPRNFDEKAGPRELDENTDLGHSEKEPSRQQFLAKFKYLQEDLGFDWSFFIKMNNHSNSLDINREINSLLCLSVNIG